MLTPIVLYVDSCHHGMGRPYVTNGEDGFQIWKVAVNILNKQSRTADKGWSSILGLGRGANNSSPYEATLLRNMRVYPKVSELAAWSENCKWYSPLPLGTVVSLFCESV